ncbi:MULTISPECIES: helix-turn-helix transcriptional regulator [unclassified Nocardioides]|uniref:helix-turn-helix domain-containing protein n=1 Tax=unclassified Nocardioides TaxID=2615069 RepID=UPI000881D31C|nr:helix-turn-helix transcriptional regulator [Nocardioides sp. YR527]SDK35203.1 Helix-turn-helix [Nocardioides sp. YR527]
MVKSKVTSAVGTLGEYLKEQRISAEMSLRQLADQAGVSNPYLSQIERGLRKPSAEVLQQIAKALRISAEQVYVRAGILSPDSNVGGSVELAVLADPNLTERQKHSLLDVYHSFLALNSRVTDDAPAADETAEPHHEENPDAHAAQD